MDLRRTLWIVGILLAVTFPAASTAAKERAQPNPAGLRPPTAGAPRWSETTIDDVLADSVAAEYWVWRHHIRVGTKLRGTIEAEFAPIRREPFADGLGRQSVRLGKVFVVMNDDDTESLAAEGDDAATAVLCVYLAEPTVDGERWLPRDDRPAVGCLEQVRFIYKGKLSETLPENFVLPTSGAVGDMPIGKFVWTSARIIPNSGAFLISKQERYALREFSDENGPAAKLRRTAKGDLECHADTLTRGINTIGRQSSDPALFDPTLYERIAYFVENRAKSTFPPSRLQRRLIFRDMRGELDLRDWPDGQVLWISARDALKIRMNVNYKTNLKEEVKIVGEYVPWGLASEEPFTDEFGPASGLRIEAAACARGMYGSTVKQTEPPWTLRLIPSHGSVLYPAVDGMRSIVGVPKPTSDDK